MNKMLLALFLGFCMIATAQGQTTSSGREEEALECLMIERMKVIEQLHGIKFDNDWKPSVRLEFPDDLLPQKKSGYYASYLADTQSFLFSPMQKYLENIHVMDHELGHALMDQVSRRSGNGPWPNIECINTLSEKEQISLMIIDEGVGAYFEYQGQPRYKDEDTNGFYWLPDGPEDFAWKDPDFKYNGGRWIVAPIIKQYGERGIVYLITHPMVYHYDQVRTGAVAYQAKALKDLAATATLRPNANWGVNSFSKLVFFVIVNT